MAERLGVELDEVSDDLGIEHPLVVTQSAGAVKRQHASTCQETDRIGKELDQITDDREPVTLPTRLVYWEFVVVVCVGLAQNVAAHPLPTLHTHIAVLDRIVDIADSLLTDGIIDPITALENVRLVASHAEKAKGFAEDAIAEVNRCAQINRSP